MHATAHVWRSEASFFELVFFLHLYVGSRNQIRVIKHAWQELSPAAQSHQALPHVPLKHHPAALGSLVIWVLADGCSKG